LSSNNSLARRGRYLVATLLERLLDDEPKSQHDCAKPVDTKMIRQLVQKDIADLINHTNIEDTLDQQHHKAVTVWYSGADRQA